MARIDNGKRMVNVDNGIFSKMDRIVKRFISYEWLISFGLSHQHVIRPKKGDVYCS